MNTHYQTSGNAFEAYPNSRSFTNRLSNHLDPVVQKHLRRVYTSLCAALSFAALGSILTLQLYVRRQRWLANIASFLTLPLLMAFNFQAPHSKWRAPLFYGFAFVDGAAAAPLLALVTAVDPRIPVIAFIAAAAVFACCSISAIFARRRSYLFIGSLCTTALLGMAFVSLLSVFWPSVAPLSTFIYLGLFVFCGYVLYDTQVIIEKAHAGERDHLRHALELLIDFLAILKRIAIILAKKSAEQDRDDDDSNNSRRRRRR